MLEKQGWERYKGEREGETGEKRREREREREKEGERKKLQTKKFTESYLVVLHSAERSQARQWIVARQVSCYNPLSCFNPVTVSSSGPSDDDFEILAEESDNDLYNLTTNALLAPGGTQYYIADVESRLRHRGGIFNNSDI